MYTNTKTHGGNFGSIIDYHIKKADSVKIASGYISSNIIQRYAQSLINIATKNNGVKLLVGMAMYEGLTNKQFILLSDLNKELIKHPNSGVFVCYSQKFHGKIYQFNIDTHNNIFVGSSNFSASGLYGNIEYNVQLNKESDLKNASNFLTSIFSANHASRIDKTKIVIKGSGDYKKKLDTTSLQSLQKYNPASINLNDKSILDISLRKIVQNKKSSLNIYFGKGRLNKKTGFVRPRPWYEVEVIVPKDIRTNLLYPKGEFLAYTDDGFIIPMKTQGDFYKNLRSIQSLSIFGMWLKGKLQKAGALLPLTLVTDETLDIYGNDTITFYKLGEKKYFMKF